MVKELQNCDYRNIYLPEGEQKIICYRTGMSVYEEIYDQGRYFTAGWNNAGSPLNVLECMPVRLPVHAYACPQAFDVEVDGLTLSYDWEYVSFHQYEEEAETTHAPLTHGVVTLRSGVVPLKVEVHTILSGSQVFTRYLNLISESDKPMRITRLAPISGGLEHFPDWTYYVNGENDKEKLYDLGYMENANGCAEGLFHWHPMASCGTTISGRYINDRFRYPMFMLRNNALGHIWFAQMAWSGGYDFRFNLDADLAPSGFDMGGARAEAKLSFSMEIAGPSPMLVLDPGESFKTPEVYIGRIHGDLDDAVNAMHTHTRRAVFTLPDETGHKAWIEAGIGPERAMTEAAILHTLNTAVATGAETLIIDAGWNLPEDKENRYWGRANGYWLADEPKYGKAFEVIRDKCREHGLRFGLWMECERICEDTPIVKEHPEWVCTRYLHGVGCQVIDMTNPEAAAWVKGQIVHLIEDYGIQLFRLDFNVSTSSFNCKRDHDGVPEDIHLRYYKALYGMFEELRREYPHIIFENCASGGARADLGMVRNFTHSWVTDYQVAPRSFAITNGMTMVIPPEYVDRLIAGMNGHLRGSLDFAVRNALMAKPTTNTYNPMGSAMNEQELAYVRRSFQLYKDFIRPNMTRIFHHTPELWTLHPQGQGILERASDDGRAAMIGVFNLANCREESITVYPRGIDAGLTYRVTFDNSGACTTVSGYELATQGVRVRLTGSMTSELILLQAE